ncbi:dTDP-4-dehydrorhamnose reductase [Novispirillum sp. DQ9]|uniref:dTDP-4-dehydrorhamnose reductase n=1 Tax=Novispirillum sp. DQ9 TaxID=3398612 RepID=UPI003C7B1AFE
MRILIVGSGGQVGTELRRLDWAPGHVVTAVDQPELDITDRAAVLGAVADLRPDVLINAAAYTAVDRCETEVALATAVNRDGPAHLAEACAKVGAALLHISTDYVFDGDKPGAYVEDDPVCPLGVYGQSKEAGERAVRDALDRHIILRTAWVYAAHGANFVRTMLRFGAERDELRVVADQVGCPTSAADIARALARIAEATAGEGAENAWGTYHYAGAGVTSWHGFAERVFDYAEPVWGRRPRVTAITTDEWPTPTRRPKNSALDCSRVVATFGVERPSWQDSLRPVVAALLAADQPAT